MNIDTPWGMASAVAELQNRLGSLPPGGRVITIGGALYVLDQNNKRASRARSDYPNAPFDRVFVEIGWVVNVADKFPSTNKESLSPGSVGRSVVLGLFCAFVALAFIGAGVEGCKDKLGMESRGSGNVDMERVKRWAEEQACLDHIKKTGDVPLECKRYDPRR